MINKQRNVIICNNCNKENIIDSTMNKTSNRKILQLTGWGYTREHNRIIDLCYDCYKYKRVNK